MTEVQQWLNSLGLGQYTDAFEENAIEWDLLTELTDEDLRTMGIAALGHRKRILKAISEMSTEPETAPAVSAPSSHEQPVPSGDAERRQLTVMFCDLVGSTQLSGLLDVETYRTVLSSYQNTARAAIAPYEGFIARYMGDGLLVYFGYPHAHEDDAERAVRAGLDIAESVQQLEVGTAERLAVRIGIATGIVVAGDIVGDGASEERAVLGETPNLAARLQAIAEPNAVLLSQSTQRLVVGRFDLQLLGTQQLKGIRDPAPVYQAVAVHSQASRFEVARRGNLTPLSGRASELSLLTQRWEQACLSEGQVVLIEGEPGIGKSRLIQALRDQIGATVSVVQRYQCSPYHTGSAFHPVIDLLERAAELSREDSINDKLDKLTTIVAAQLPGDEHAPALMGALLSLPIDRFPPLNMTQQKQRLETIRVLIAQLHALASNGPVLMLFEDAHWCDPSTLELFGSIIHQIQSLPVLLLITHRPEFLSPWTGYGHATTYSLNRLGRQDVTGVVEGVTGGKSLPAEVMAQILAKTDGVPLFVEELTKTVLESGLLVDAGDMWRLDGPLPALAIPSTLQDSLLSRLDRVVSVKEVAQLGACIGREFAYELLAAVSSMQGNELNDALTQLTNTELVFRRGEIPTATFMFKHALVQDTARDTLLTSVRQQRHHQIAKAIQKLYPEVEGLQPEVLAYHFTEAGITDTAIDLWKRAGEAALQRSANSEAIAHLRRALDLLRDKPEDDGRDTVELALQISLGGALMTIEGYASSNVGQAYARARDLCERIGQVPETFAALAGLWLFTSVGGRIKPALVIAEQLLALAESLAQDADDTAPLVAANRAVGVTRLWCGEPGAAHVHFAEAVKLYQRVDRSVLKMRYGLDLGTAALYGDAWSLWWSGYPEQGLQRTLEARDLAAELDHPFSTAWTLVWRALFHVYRREVAHVDQLADELITLADDQQFAQAAGLGRIVRGWADTFGVQPEQGIETMREGIAGWTGTGARLMVSHWYTFLADAFGRINEPAEGLRLASFALNEVETTGQRSYEAEIFRVRGELLSLTPGMEGESQACYRRAIEVAQKQGSKSLGLRAATSLARALAKGGEPDAARAVLAPNYAWFTEGFDTPDLEDAKSELAGLA